MNHYYTFFDGRKFETVAPTKQRGTNNLIYKISRTYRQFSRPDIKSRIIIRESVNDQKIIKKELTQGELFVEIL